MILKTFSNAPKFAKLQEFAIAVQTGTMLTIIREFEALKNDPMFSSVGWRTNFDKLDKVFFHDAPQYSIFALGGNSKLPFVSFSTLPGVTCPGAGDCINFCYSYRAWRYPAAFARMVQNAYLLRFAPNAIADAFSLIAAKRVDGFDFRLYVDGDFSGGGDVAFWMQLLKDTPNARAYGYSKSFAALLGYDTAFGGAWPTNYQLNISGGHNASQSMVNYVKALPITRGEFVAVSIGKKVKSNDHGTIATNAALRAAFPDQKIFPCPGTCGTCTGKGHACGMPQMKNRIIAIAMH
jgi:hypothetical protein